jgi:hypothetical protein
MLFLGARSSSSDGNNAFQSTFTTAEGASVEAFATTLPPGMLDGQNLVDLSSRQRPDSVLGYLDRWEAERARIIFNLEAEYGLDDNGLLRTPGGIEIDTTACPADWSDTAGVTDDAIRLGVSGGQYSWSESESMIGGLSSYFEWVNAQGGVGPDGLRLEAIGVDPNLNDAEPEELLAAVAENNLFSLSTDSVVTLGWVYETLNEACIPQPFVSGTHPTWADPNTLPWTTGLERTLRSEAAAWHRWITDGGQIGASTRSVTVAALVTENEVGLIYEDGFRATSAEQWTGNSNPVDFVVVRNGPGVDDLSSAVDELLAADPDVVIVMGDGAGCEPALQAVSQSMSPDTWNSVIVSTTCAATLNSIDTAPGDWLLFTDGLRTSTDPGSAIRGSGVRVMSDEYNPFVEFMTTRLETEELSPMNGDGMGFGLYGWAFHQTLEIASRLPGGLTRTNFVLAQRSLTEMTVPISVTGINFGVGAGGGGGGAATAVDGDGQSTPESQNPTPDPYYLEDAQILWLAPDGSGLASDVTELDGITPNCPWRSVSVCG